MGKLQIAKEISLPIDAITQTMAAIGRKGSGKTYLSQMIAEQMLDARGQVAVVDPVGNWWGLRVDADGKTKGKQIFVIGGDHGDVPLVPEAGRRIAQLLVDKGISAVLDVSSFGIGERKRFCADFAEEFFQLKKKKRSPVHLFLEEAQLVVPQNIRPEEGRMYSAFEQIVRLGRNYGIGCTLITQRPQSVNKEVLSQIECLCVLQITGPHERKAIEYWVQEAGADRKLIGELPGLARGEGFVWSPSWLKIYKRVHFSKKQTFDASATPEVGKKTRSASLSAVDVSKLKADIVDVVAQAERDDPVALRKKIAELEKRSNTKIAVQAIVENALKEQERGLLQAFEKERAQYRFALTHASTTLKKIAELTSRPDVLELTKSPIQFRAPTVRIVKVAPVVQLPPASRTLSEPQAPSEITGPEQRILNAIAWMNSIGVEIPEKPAVAFVAGYSPSSSGFQNACGALRRKGLVNYASGGVVLTDLGKQQAEIPHSPISNEELQRKILEKLPGPERRTLKALIDVHPEEIFKGILAERAGYSGTSSGFQNACGRLRTLGMVEYTRNGMVKAASILFPLA